MRLDLELKGVLISKFSSLSTLVTTGVGLLNHHSLHLSFLAIFRIPETMHEVANYLLMNLGEDVDIFPRIFLERL